MCHDTAADEVKTTGMGHSIIRLTGILSNPHGYTNAHKKCNMQTPVLTHAHTQAPNLVTGVYYVALGFYLET